MGFTCFRCLITIDGNIEIFFSHLKYIHNISTNSQTKIVCSQDGCEETFSYCSSFKRHLQSKHKEGISHVNEPDEVDDAIPVHVSMPASTSESTNTTNDSEEDKSGEEQINLRREFELFVSKLQASSIPLSVTQNVVKEVEELILYVLKHLENEVNSVAKNAKQNHVFHSVVFDELQKKLLCLKTLFNGLRTQYQRDDHWKNEGLLILPEEKLVGKTFASHTDKTGQIKQVEQRETYQYVPIKKTLQVFLEQQGVLASILEDKTSTDKDVVESFYDGSFYQEKVSRPTAADKTNSLVLPLLLYSDAYETANPLGSRKGIHKLTGFYMSVPSLPAKYQAVLGSIMLVACAKSSILSKYGIDCVLSAIVKDLNKLQDDCIKVTYRGSVKHVKPVLFQVTGDNLGLHDMLGFTASFSANFPCRFCKAPKEVIRCQLVEDMSILRNKENFDADSAIGNISLTGIKRVSVLNEVNGYHVTDNHAPDVMHDLLEGVLPLEMKLTVRSLIDQGCFTLDELNSRISSFGYGQVDKKNKPSSISQSAINNPGGPSGQKAAQMMCLAKYLPLIIGDLVEEGSDVWEVFLMLLHVDIYKVVMARSISISATYSLKHFIHDHHSLFLQVYPDRHFTPKQHFILHYPRVIRYLGPLLQFSSMRYEAKHRQFKKWAQACNNFQNIAKTVSMRHQQAQSNLFLTNSVLQCKVDVQNQVLVKVSSVGDDERVICETLGCTKDTSVIVANAAELYGYQLKPNTIVLTDWDEEGPKFAQVQHILVFSGEVMLVLKPWNVKGFCRHYHAYIAQGTDGNDFLKRPVDLLDHRPYHITQCNDEHDLSLYIVMQFNLI